MIVYPTDDFNSWVSQVDADAIAQDYLDYDKWDALDVETQERYLMQAFRTINALPDFSGPDATVPDDVMCLPTAQVQIVLHDLKYGLSASTTNGQNAQIASLVAGPTSITYYELDSQIVVGVIPAETAACMELFGVTAPSSCGPLGSTRKVR